MTGKGENSACVGIITYEIFSRVGLLLAACNISQTLVFKMGSDSGRCFFNSQKGLNNRRRTMTIRYRESESSGFFMLIEWIVLFHSQPLCNEVCLLEGSVYGQSVAQT